MIPLKKEPKLAKLRTDLKHPLDPGAIVLNSWGFDQTNLDWYVVVRRTDHYVWLFEIKGHLLKSDDDAMRMSGYEMPLEPPPLDNLKYAELVRHKFTISPTNGVRVNFKYGGGAPWDGEKKYVSWYA